MDHPYITDVLTARVNRPPAWGNQRLPESSWSQTMDSRKVSNMYLSVVRMFKHTQKIMYKENETMQYANRRSQLKFL